MELSSKAHEVVTARYFMNNETSWDDLAIRVGHGIGKESYGERYTQIISAKQFIPAGRILRNVNRPRGSLFNCYCLPIGDSREEIGELFKNALILWGEGGGVGINFSTLRPIGSEIKGVGGRSSGLVSFMRAVDGIAATIESGGQRRAASLGLCEVWHPEIKDFINSKQTDGDISYFNISVGINEAFVDAVRRDEKWELHFNRRPTSRVDAKVLWQNIMKGMVKNGEPGLINMSNLTRNNSYYFAPVRGTNPCGETCLEDYGVCNLGSIVLPAFVVNGRVKWKEMEDVIRLGIRFLDTCIDINRYSLERIKQTAIRGRRIGLGVMGLADMLFNLNLRYGKRDAIDFIERLMKFIRNISYEESVKIATEKGAFPAFESNLYCKSKFIRTLPPSLRTDIRAHGTRNVTNMAIAPTGTISLIPETTSSIEPLMYKAYERRDRVSNRYYIHPLYDNILMEGAPNPEWYVDSTDLSPQEHLDTQIAVQKYVDGAVSKTINVPKNFKASDLSSLLLESIDDLKGVTVYRDGSRKGQIIRPLTSSKDLERARNEGGSKENAVPQVCATGSCNLD
jgi:ribonucleoside-diphosphate reductase alpha chain